jgi:ABC-2 type transport system permease protein
MPGIIVMTAAYGSSVTAQSVNRDSTEGIIARFRTMAISPASVLNGHVASALARTLVSAALVIGVAIGLGFRPTADAGLTALLALTWLAVPFGLAAKTAEGLSGFILIVQLLPFISSAFVPPGQMSGSVRWFAAHQPFTPVIDTPRAADGETIGGGERPGPRAPGPRSAPTTWRAAPRWSPQPGRALLGARHAGGGV